ncbi:MAG: hypothetical protein AMXMBFR7_14090 [Planctomycetota bacterium]
MADPLSHSRYWKLPTQSDQPLYQQIRELILRHLEAGRAKPGDLLPSYPWLSKTLGVADKTVRQAYAELERAGVLEIRRGKGTFVAHRGTETGADLAKTGVIGILPPPLPVDLSDETFFWRVMRGMQEAAFAEHLDTLVLARAGDLRNPGSAERLADRRRMDGLALLGQAAEDFLKRLHALHFPAVLVDAHFEQAPVDCVVLDNAGAGRDLTYRLIGLGHRKIGFLGIPRGQSSKEREAGYRHAMGAAGLPVSPDWVARADVDLGESGQAAADALLDRGLTAVVAFNGGLAQGVAEVAAKRGLRVPRDLSIVATAASGLWMLPGGIPLEHLAFDPQELGTRAVKLLAERIAGSDELPRKSVVPARPVAGGSLAPPGTTGSR